MKEQHTDFGFQSVPEADKTGLVEEVFESVASRYDVMNDLMSAGIHRLWKRFAVSTAGLRPGQRVLDLAGGTGDLAKLISKSVGSNGSVVLADFNAAMLSHGRSRLLDEGIVEPIKYARVDAQSLPFDDEVFDRIFIGFGLRNVTSKRLALSEMSRCLRPGGSLIVLEFSQLVSKRLQSVYDAYSFRVLPKIGQLVTGDGESYQYLVESIRMHPDQEALKAMILDCGFDRCDYHNLTGGVVAVHRAYRY